MDALKRPYARKREEVRRANRRAEESVDLAQYECTMTDIRTKHQLMQQAERVKQVTDENGRLSTQLHNKEAELENAQQELEGLGKKFSTLELGHNHLRKQMESAQGNFEETLKAEQLRLITENEADCQARMEMAWELINPGADYETWSLAYEYADEVINAREDGEPEPPPFETWLAQRTGEADAEEQEEIPPPDA